MASEDVVVHVIRQFLKEEADQVLMQLLPIEDRSYLIAKLYLDIFHVSLPHFTKRAIWKYFFTRGASCLEKGGELVEKEDQ